MNTIRDTAAAFILKGLVIAMAAAFACEVEAQDSLVGVWEAEHRFSHSDRTAITIKPLGDQWNAVVGKQKVDIGELTETNSDIRFEVSSEDGATLSGQFRGKFDLKAQTISGHWIHGMTGYTNYPVAVPLVFERDSDGFWQAIIPERLERMRLFLCIKRGESGHLTAFVRNPERNQGISWGTCNVESGDGQIKLINPDRNLVVPCKLEKQGGKTTLSADFPGWDPTFVFRKLESPGTHASFGPRPEKSAYEYQVPEKIDDNWDVASANQVRMNKPLLTAMVQSIRDTKTDSLYDPYIHSVLIARKGKLVLEEYFYGFDREHEHDTRSAGKSVGSMIVGTAIDRHADLNLDRKLSSIFGDRFLEPNKEIEEPSWDQRQAWRSTMTIGHALSMSSGLHIDDDTDSSPGSEGLMQDQSQQPDWVQFVLDVPMLQKPGVNSVYGSNHINLAGAAVAEATGEWLPDLFHENIAMPLEIKSYQFNLDPSGNGYVGGGIRLRPRDQLKLGQVMLDRGKWKNKRVLSKEWVNQSLTPAGSINEPDDYCYGWWRKPLPFKGRTVDVWNAGGNGGQFIVFVPELEIVVQISGGNYRNFPVWYRHLTHMIPKYILASVEDAQ